MSGSPALSSLLPLPTRHIHRCFGFVVPFIPFPLWPPRVLPNVFDLCSVCIGLLCYSGAGDVDPRWPIRNSNYNNIVFIYTSPKNSTNKGEDRLVMRCRRETRSPLALYRLPLFSALGHVHSPRNRLHGKMTKNRCRTERLRIIMEEDTADSENVDARQPLSWWTNGYYTHQCSLLHHDCRENAQSFHSTVISAVFHWLTANKGIKWNNFECVLFYSEGNGNWLRFWNQYLH